MCSHAARTEAQPTDSTRPAEQTLHYNPHGDSGQSRQFAAFTLRGFEERSERIAVPAAESNKKLK